MGAETEPRGRPRLRIETSAPGELNPAASRSRSHRAPSRFPAPVLESGRRAKLKGRSRIPELICFFLFDARPRYRLSGPL